jgi:hypothetical protein
VTTAVLGCDKQQGLTSDFGALTLATELNVAFFADGFCGKFGGF